MNNETEIPPPNSENRDEPVVDKLNSDTTEDKVSTSVEETNSKNSEGAKNLEQEVQGGLHDEAVELKTGSSTPFMDRSIFYLKRNPIEKLIEDFTAYPQNHFEKQGFYLAIDPESVSMETAKKKLKELITREEKKIDDLSHDVEFHVSDQTEEIKESLKELTFQIGEQEEKLDSLKDLIAPLEEEKEVLLESIKEIKSEIREIAESIGLQRENIIEKRIQALKSELREIIATYEEISEQKARINEKEFNVNKEIYAQRASRYEGLYQMASERLALVQQKLKKVPGITHRSQQFLFWAGLGAAGGAGWFFSVYIVDRSVYTADFLSFFFSRLFSVGDGFPTLSGITLGLVMILTLGGILLLTTALSWIGQKLLLNNLGLGKEREQASKRSRSKKSEEETGGGIETDVTLSFGDDEKNYYRTRIKAETFFSFWVQALPVIFLLGILFIILSISGTGSHEVTQLMSALSGQVMGTSIAFGVAGLVYIYIRYIIDPRLEKAKGETPNTSGFYLALNKELVGVFVAVILSLVSMVIWPDQSFVAIIGYIGITLMTGLVIGYAVYFRSLLLNDQELKHEIVHLSFAIDNCRRPRPLYIMGAEGQQFKYNYLLLMEQMYKLSEIRNMQATELLVGREVTSRVRLSGRMPRREYQGFRLLKNIKRLFTKAKISENENDSEIAELTGVESNYYQEHQLLLRNLKHDLKQKETQLASVAAESKALQSEGAEVQRVHQERLKRLKKHQQNLIEARERLGRLRISAHQKLNSEKEKRTIALRDGFDLGLWHRANDVEPTPKYRFEPNPQLSTTN